MTEKEVKQTLFFRMEEKIKTTKREGLSRFRVEYCEVETPNGVAVTLCIEEAGQDPFLLDLPPDLPVKGGEFSVFILNAVRRASSRMREFMTTRTVAEEPQ